MFKRFLRHVSGATAIEYALIAMLVSAAAIGGITAVGQSTGNQMNTVAAQFPG